MLGSVERDPLEAFRNLEVYEGSGPFLRRFSKEAHETDNVNVEDYRVYLRYENSVRNHNNPRRNVIDFSRIIYDASYSFVLCRRKHETEAGHSSDVFTPIASLGFDLDGLSTEERRKVSKSFKFVSKKLLRLFARALHLRLPKEDIVVKQIQGVRGTGDYLTPLRWERMLLSLAIDWARRNDYDFLKVITAKESRWYNERRHEGMYMKYDVTARREGLEFDEKENKYVLALNLR